MRCCADIVRTYISRDICPHYILLRFSALGEQIRIFCSQQNIHSLSPNNFANARQLGILKKMLQVILLHDFIVAVVVVQQVVGHVVDWVLHTWSLVPHTPNWVVVVAEKPPTSPESHHHVVAEFVAVDVEHCLLPIIVMFLKI